MQGALGEAGLVTLETLPTYAVLFKESGLASSLGDARRAIAEGGLYVNNERVSDGDAEVPASALLHGRFLVLRRGKRNLAGVELRSSMM